jgi:hypothetical protein
MLEIVRAALPKVKGLIAINCEGRTEDYRYHPAPYLLMADLYRAGLNTRRPAFFHRIGIPGSGSTDWLRADVEPVVCVTRPGKLPWSDNTACGHPPRWAPGGEMSNRLTNGTRVNQWGMRVRADGSLTATDPTQGDGLVARATKPSHKVVEVGEAADATPTLFDDGERTELAPIKNAFGTNRSGIRVGARRGKDDHKASEEKPAHAQRKRVKKADKLVVGGKRHTKRDASPQENGDAMREQVYLPPVLANPGNVIQQTYTADEVAALLAGAGSVVHCNVGGGQMGHPLTHDNEAPFPLSLAAFFVKSFCPPGGVVADCFLGSGTTAHAALEPRATIHRL